MHVIRVLLVLSLTTVTNVYTVQVCGKALADVIDLVCSGRGFYTFNQRGVPSIKKRAALQFLKKRIGPTPLGHQGIVTECCFNACSFEHIENYCAAPPGHETANPTHAPLSQHMAEAFFESEAVNSLGDLYAQGDVPPSSATTHSTPRPAADTSDLEDLNPITATFRWPISAPTATGRRASLLTPPIINRNPNLRSRFFFVRHMNLQPTRAPVIS